MPICVCSMPKCGRIAQKKKQRNQSLERKALRAAVQDLFASGDLPWLVSCLKLCCFFILMVSDPASAPGHRGVSAQCEARRTLPRVKIAVREVNLLDVIS